jgi:hypothetical protein
VDSEFFNIRTVAFVVILSPRKKQLSRLTIIDVHLSKIVVIVLLYLTNRKKPQKAKIIRNIYLPKTIL